MQSNETREDSGASSVIPNMGVSLGRNTHTYACTCIFVRTLIDIIHSTDSYPNRYNLVPDLIQSSKLNLKTQA